LRRAGRGFGRLEAGAACDGKHLCHEILRFSPAQEIIKKKTQSSLKAMQHFSDLL
jgi:hypothetical protein